MSHSELVAIALEIKFPLIPLPIKEAIQGCLGGCDSISEPIKFPLIPLPIKEAIFWLSNENLHPFLILKVSINSTSYKGSDL